jgi:hypothetical protein
MAAIPDFRSMLSKVLGDKGISVSRWAGTSRPSDHLLQIETAGKATVLYVKESNTPNRGFWGLTRNQVEKLESARIRWFAILLHGSINDGYLLSGGQVELRVRDGLFELSRDGDYKVNEKTDLNAEQRFLGLPQLLARVL